MTIETCLSISTLLNVEFLMYQILIFFSIRTIPQNGCVFFGNFICVLFFPYFSYLPERKILDGISFVVPSGKSVAIVGTSGSGIFSVVLFYIDISFVFLLTLIINLNHVQVNQPFLEWYSGSSTLILARYWFFAGFLFLIIHIMHI